MTTSGPSSRPDAVVFCALVLGEELGTRLLELARATLDTGRGPAPRFPRPEGLHLTLLYLGAASGAAVDAWHRALERELHGLAAPRLRLASTGRFPERGAPRVLWVGVEEEGAGGRLAALRNGALTALRRAGVGAAVLREEEERPYRPHVTVARPVRPRARVPAAFRALDPGLPWRPREAVLVASVRGDGPARYVPLERYPLGGGPPGEAEDDRGAAGPEDPADGA